MLSSLAVLLFAACQPGAPPLVVSRVRGHGGAVGGVSVSSREAGGLSDAAVVTVATRLDADGAWHEAVVTSTGGEDRLEVALVADNSGSEEGYLDPMQAGVDAFGEAVLGRGLGDRVGLVRVTTQSEVVLPLTDDLDTWSAAVDGLFIGNGWTALWDGVRLGNEVLDAGATATAGAGLEVCLSQARRSVVVFTDGQENNSADEHATSYPGDGIDTTLADLESLQVLGVPTPVFPIGIGNGVDEDALSELADTTGGTYAAIDGYADLAATLTATAEDLGDEIPVCFEAVSCEHTEGLVLVIDGDESFEATFELPALCEDAGSGDGGADDGGTDEGEAGCTRTRGYWTTHEEAWPVDRLTLGDRNYDQDACLDVLDAPTKGDKSLQLASQLIAAKLNVAAGADDAEVSTSIDAADAWLVAHDDGDGLPLSVGSWDGGEEIKDALDAWNNGDSGPGHCD